MELNFQCSWPRLKHSATSAAVDHLNCGYCRGEGISSTVIKTATDFHVVAHHFKEGGDSTAALCMSGMRSHSLNEKQRIQKLISAVTNTIS